jgi:hypothetical protein
MPSARMGGEDQATASRTGGLALRSGQSLDSQKHQKQMAFFKRTLLKRPLQCQPQVGDEHIKSQRVTLHDWMHDEVRHQVFLRSHVFHVDIPMAVITIEIQVTDLPMDGLDLHSVLGARSAITTCLRFGKSIAKSSCGKQIGTDVIRRTPSLQLRGVST